MRPKTAVAASPSYHDAELTIIAAGVPGLAQTPGKKEGQKSAAEKNKVKDPVCGMVIDPSTAAGEAQYNGKTYYFCSREEKEKFEKSPETYVKKPKGTTKKTS